MGVGQAHLHIRPFVSAWSARCVRPVSAVLPEGHQGLEMDLGDPGTDLQLSVRSKAACAYLRGENQIKRV